MILTALRGLFHVTLGLLAAPHLALLTALQLIHNAQVVGKRHAEDLAEIVKGLLHE